MRALPALPDERGFEFFLTYLLSAFPEMFGHAPVIFAGRVWGAFQSPMRRASSVSSTRPPPPRREHPQPEKNILHTNRHVTLRQQQAAQE